jgi:hypothetical protein
MNRLKLNISILTLISFVLLVSGCASTWVETSPEWKPQKQVPVLLGYYHVESNAGADLFDLAKQGAGSGASFADVSLDTYKLMAESLKKFNLELKTDRERTKKLDSIAKEMKELKTGNEGADELIGSLTSQWDHPDTADVAFHRLSTLVDENIEKNVINKLKGNNKNELFLSANIKIEDQDQWLVMKRFRLILSLKVMDVNANTVLQARAEGFTSMKFMRNPISEGRLQGAMADALSQLEKAEIKPEISSVNNL